jgi:hypothetical protein
MPNTKTQRQTTTKPPKGKPTPLPFQIVPLLDPDFDA